MRIATRFLIAVLCVVLALACSAGCMKFAQNLGKKAGQTMGAADASNGASDKANAESETESSTTKGKKKEKGDSKKDDSRGEESDEGPGRGRTLDLSNLRNDGSGDGGELSEEESRGYVESIAELTRPGYELVVGSEYDLDDDGVTEGIMGFQCTETDEMGEPTQPAYFEIAFDVGGSWKSWFTIDAPGGETMLDDNCILGAEDVNGDGHAEIFLMFYGFGVSGRPENIYVWRLFAEENELRSAIVGGVAETTNRDGLKFADIDEFCPGPEMIFAIMQLGDEAMADAHAYAIEVWGWSEDDEIYDYQSGGASDTKYASATDAMDAFLAGEDYQ